MRSLGVCLAPGGTPLMAGGLAGCWAGAVPQQGSAAPALAAAPSWGEAAIFSLMDRLPPVVLPGLSTYESVILIGGFLGMLLFYGAGKLTGSAFFRLIMPWAIGFLGVATIYLMFVSDLSNRVAARYPTKSSGSLIRQYQRKGQDISDKQQRRLREFDRTNAQD